MSSRNWESNRWDGGSPDDPGAPADRPVASTSRSGEGGGRAVADAARMARHRLESLRRLLERGGERPKVLNDYAGDLLTIEAPDLRDPAAALPLAERACALAEERGTYGRWNYLDTLALAQHITGDTAKAIETEKRALAMLPPEYHQQRKEFEDRLAEFEAALAEKTAVKSAP